MRHISPRRILFILWAAMLLCCCAVLLGGLCQGLAAVAVPALALLALLVCSGLYCRRHFISEQQAMDSLALQKKVRDQHIAALNRSLEQTRRQRHELRHHAEALRGLALEGDTQRLLAYLERFGLSVDGSPTRYSDNPLVNALLVPRMTRLRQLQTQIDLSVTVPDHLGIEDLDLAVFLANLLDNAVEALEAVEEERRCFSLRLSAVKSRLVVQCSNACAALSVQRGLPSTTKGEGHGNGLPLMQEIAQRYNGLLDIRVENGVFTLRSTLMLGSPSPEKVLNSQHFT